MLESPRIEAAVAKAIDLQVIASSPVQFEWIRTRAAFDALEAEWNELFEKSGRDTQVFQTFNWNWHWANHFVGGDSDIELAIVVGRRNGCLITVWPLAKTRAHGVAQIAWMGEPVSQYGDVLLDAHQPDAMDILKAGWEFLSSHEKADVVIMRRVRADSIIAPLLQETGAIVTDRQQAPFLDLSSARSFEKYEARFSGRSRANRRRLARRLDERGEAKFERHESGLAAKRLTSAAVELKQRWLDDRGLVSAAFADPRTARFFADAAESREKSTSCIVSTITVDGEPAAVEVSFACKGRIAMHITTFNLEFEKSGVGVLRIEQSLRDAYEQGYETYDMLAPGAPYKFDWADKSIEVLDWSLPLTLAGHAYANLYVRFVRPNAKRALQALPPSVRRILTGKAARAA